MLCGAGLFDDQSRQAASVSSARLQDLVAPSRNLQLSMRGPIHDLHPSNLLTYTALAAAIAAMAVAGSRGGAAFAGALLAIAALADTFDGRFARSFMRTERQRRTGRELDSLVDIVGFGVAPVVVLATLSPPEGAVVASLWWMAAGAYVL